jgi:sulfur carrier protein
LPANSIELLQSGTAAGATPVNDETSLARTILVNGDPVATRAGTLAELLAELGHTGGRVATARNGDFVPERARTSTLIERDDRIEIVSPRQGG